MHSLLFKCLLTTVVIVVSIVILSVSPIHSQAVRNNDDSKERVVKIILINNSPIEVTDVRIRESSITSKKHITARRHIGEWVEFKSMANEDWLSSLVFTIRNVSEGPIVAITAELQIDHAGIDLPVSLPLTPGKALPAFLNKEHEAESNLKSLMPGEEITYHLGPQALRIWAEALNRFKTSGSASVVELNILRVQFDRDTSWSNGEIFFRNPGKPSEWVPERRTKNRKIRVGLAKAAHERAPASVRISFSATQGTGGCRNSSNDVLFHCFFETVECDGIDQTVGNEFGSFNLIDAYVTCYDWSHSPCNTSLIFGSRRRLNRNCIV